MSRVGIEFYGIDAGATKECQAAIAQLEKLRAATTQTTEAADASAEATTTGAKAKVEALVGERQTVRANMVAYEELAAAAADGSEEQVAATTLATAAQRELGIAVADNDALMAKSGASARNYGGAMSKAFTGIFAAAIAGMGVKHILDVTQTYEAAQATLVTTMKNVGVSYADAKGQLDPYLKDLSKLSGQSLPELQKAMSQNLIVTKNVGLAERDTAIAANIAAARHVSLSAAAQMVTKAEMGMTGLLRRAGIDIKPVTTAQDELTAAHVKASPALKAEAKALDATATKQKAMAMLQKTFTNQAEAYGKTAGGAADRLRNSWDQLEVAVGRALTPTLGKLADRMATWIEQMEKTGELQRDATATARALGQIISAIVPIVVGFAKALNSVAKAVGGWGNAFKIILTGVILLKLVALVSWVLKLRAAFLGVASAEVLANTTGATAFAALGKGAAGMNGKLLTLVKSLGLIVAGFVAANEASKLLFGKSIKQALSTDSAGGGGVPVWDPKTKKWVDPATGKPMGKAAQKHWNEEAKKSPGLKDLNPYTGRSTNPIVAKAQQLGVGSGGVYQKGGGHGGIVKPGSVLDCSGYTYQIFTQNGFKGFPGTSETQWSTDSGPNWASERIPASQAKPGDLVFSVGSGYASPGHVGIVVSGSGANAEVMQYYSTGKPADTVKLSSKSDLVGVKRFYLVKQGAKSTAPSTGGGTTTSAQAQYEKDLAAAPSSSAAKKAKSTATFHYDVKVAQTTGKELAKSVEAIISPTLRSNLRKQVSDLNKELANVANPLELRTAETNSRKLAAAIKAALALNSVVKQLKADVGKIAAEVALLPAAMRAPLAAKLKALYKELGDVTSKTMVTKIKGEISDLEKLYSAALDKLKQTVDDKRSAFSTAWSRLASDALQAFDAGTQALLDASDKGYDEQTKAAEAANALQTPAEQRLAQMQSQQTSSNLQDQVDADRAALLKAQQMRPGWDGTIQDRQDAIAAAEKQLNDDLYSQDEQAVSDQADLERKAADDVLTVQEQAIQDQKDLADKAIQDQRDVLKTALSDRLDMISTEFESDEPEVVSQGQKDLAALLSDPDFKTLFANSGTTIGTAFAGAFTAALQTTEDAVKGLLASLGQLDLATGVTPPSVPASYGGIGPGGSVGYFAAGGKVPGVFVGRQDTVAARLTPGETVIDRGLTSALADYLDGGGAGDVHVHFHGPVFGGREKVAKELAPAIQSATDRQIRYRRARG